MIRVYVVVVTYNASRWLFKCLSSFKESNLQLNIVVVDNNSIDDTLTIVNDNFKEVTVIKNNCNAGFDSANNMGMKYALENDADFVFLLNQDAWVQPETLHNLIQVSTGYPDYYILSPIHLAGNEEQLDLNFSYYAGPAYCGQLFSDFVVRPQNLNKIYETSFVN